MGEVAQRRLETGIAEAHEAAAQGGEMPLPFGREGAEHGQQQAQVLDQHGRVFDAPTGERAQADLDQRDRHHQRQRERAQRVVDSWQAAPRCEGRTVQDLLSLAGAKGRQVPEHLVEGVGGHHGAANARVQPLGEFMPFAQLLG
jgi:hypothetical protein